MENVAEKIAEKVIAKPELANTPGYDGVGMPLKSEEVVVEVVEKEEPVIVEEMKEVGRKMFWRLISRTVDKFGVMTTVHGSTIAEIGVIIKTVHSYPDGSLVANSFLVPKAKLITFTQENPADPTKKIAFFDLVQPDAVDMNAGRF